MNKNTAATKQVAKKNSRISDYFLKAPAKEATSEVDNKRKFAELNENGVLRSVTNIKIEKDVSPTSKKLKHGENATENSHPTYQEAIYNRGMCSGEGSMMNRNKNLNLQRTPSKQSKSPSSSSEKRKQNRATPRKSTPKKLFEKSPKKLEQFNVQVLEQFVRLTPSKNNTSPLNKVLNVVMACNISPSSSEIRSIQKQNETTPTKIKSEPSSSLNNKARTKLDFQDNIKIEKSPEKLKVEPPEEPAESINTQFDVDNLESIFNNMVDEEFIGLVLNGECKELNFEQAQHCKIVSTEAASDRIILTLKATKSGEVGTCVLKQFWVNNRLEIGAIVYIQAVKDPDNHWIVDNQNGWLVYEPDLLISCTSVVGSLFCKRRSVLSERYSGFEPTNRVMVVGILVHLLLQTVLKEDVKSRDAIMAKLREIISSESVIRKLYESGVSLQEIESELTSFVPQIIQFIREYVEKTSKSIFKSDNWKGKISGIDDIEENLWCPELGLKGKIDVTVRSDANLLPLEIKTGRASVSLEHRGQVILYIMMMNKFGYKVSSGLLLYLREAVVLKEILATPQEQRDILILRNELAYYISKNAVSEKNKGTKMNVFDLPEPINHHSACGKCSYNVICASFLKFNNDDLTKNKSLQEIKSCISAYLTDEHLNYFMHWSNLLRMEFATKTGEKSFREIFTRHPEQREKKGKCIINMKITFVGDGQNSLYLHTFEKHTPYEFTNFVSSGICENSYIIVSTNKRPAVATGFVTEITSSSITMTLDRNLNKKYSDQLFHLDTYDSTMAQTFNLSCLAILLENTPRATELRNIIIDKCPPEFSPKLPAVVAKRGAPILKRLNITQQKAVLKALSAKSYFLIKGMPGTGKTATIVALIRLLVVLDKSVLITSHTHSAVDNVCNRLLSSNVDFIRLGSVSRVNEKLKSKSEYSLTKHCKTPEELNKIYNSCKVIAVTCLGSGHPLLSKRTVDVCIVDESTQVLQASVIRTLYAAKTFVLIGDPEQLAPVVRNKDALNAGMSESLFERLNTTNSTITLTLNYRINKTITDLANALTYDGQLLPANDAVANNTLKLPKIEITKSNFKHQQWVLDALDCSLEASVQFIDTGPVWKSSQTLETNFSDNEFGSQNCKNLYEANIVNTLVEALTMGGVCDSDIGVIATYRAQVAEISAMLNVYKTEVSTVDQFQGRDKNIIIYSCTKSRDNSNAKRDELKYEILEDKRRLTVAVTRAKQKLILIGDRSTLCSYATFSKIFESLDDQRFIMVHK